MINIGAGLPTKGEHMKHKKEIIPLQPKVHLRWQMQPNMLVATLVIKGRLEMPRQNIPGQIWRLNVNRKDQLRWRNDTSLSPDGQNPWCHPLNNGITNKISELCANSRVLNLNGRRGLCIVVLPLKIPPKWGEKILHTNTILENLKEIHRTGIIRQKTLPNRETFVNRTSFKMTQVTEAKVGQNN